LEYHLRLLQQKRAILDQVGGKTLPEYLFEFSTVNGARALGVATGSFEAGRFADFVTIDLEDSSIAGNSVEDLLSTVVFSMNRSAIRDVVVGGRFILRDQQHIRQEEIVAQYKELYEAVWGNADRRS